MSDNKLLEELKRLYQLAVLRDGEEDDEGRKNEARNAAYLLINKARKGGVRLKFELPQARPKEPAIRVEIRDSGSVPDMHDITDFMRRAREAGSDPFEDFGVRRPPGQTADDAFVDMLNQFQKGAARRRAEASSPFNTNPGNFRAPSGANPFGQHRSRRSARAQVMLLRSRFGGVCIACSEKYARDELVHWVRKIGCTHERCGSEVLERLAKELEEAGVDVDASPGGEAP